MERIGYELPDGEFITIAALSISATYRVLIAGEPSERINKMIIDGLSYPKEWGKFKHVIKTNNMYAEKGVLKPFTISALLVGPPIGNSDTEFNGSSLVVTWLANEIQGKSIETILLDGVSSLNWYEFAENLIV